MTEQTFDFGALEITPSEEPLPAQVRATRSAGPNPFEDALKASVEHSTPYSIYVPVDAVSRAASLINQAARKHGFGVRIVANVQRDERGAVVKGSDGKAIYLPEQRGPNKGKVLVRFQGNTNRKEQKAPRPYSIVNDPENRGQKMIRHRETGNIVARGTHEQMKARYAELKAGQGQQS